jgi:hypothetical protein
MLCGLTLSRKYIKLNTIPYLGEDKTRCTPQHTQMKPALCSATPGSMFLKTLPKNWIPIVMPHSTKGCLVPITSCMVWKEEVITLVAPPKVGPRGLLQSSTSKSHLLLAEG